MRKADIRISGVVIAIAVASGMAACGGSKTTDEESAHESTPGSTTTTIPAESSEGAVLVTPSQQEGPYYPAEKPADADNDLTTVNGSAERPQGEVLALDGLLLYSDGSPVENATIEIWQTDANGVYLHPDFAGRATDPAFQYFGEALTDAAGEWSFLTILPVAYENRPPHIHVKVLVDGDEMLTTQIYFSAGGSDPGTAEALLVAEVFPAPDGTSLEASHVIVLAG
jgi:protocatechuate 3,4-dioxygenase beta subunit